MTPRLLSMFSGIGGLDLGMERAGFRVVRQCEIDPYCRKVLARHWPGVPCHDDVATMTFTEGEADVICGGFPCQDVSNAGTRAGLAGERSGLYGQLVRAVRVVRPLVAVLENVAALLGRGMGRVLGDLAESGYDAEWDCVPACAVGAPHTRDRVFVVAHPARRLGNRHGVFCRTGIEAIEAESAQWLSDGRSIGVVDGQGDRRTRRVPDPGVCRVVDGLPGCPHRLRGLGNAVVPQVAEVVGRRVMEYFP